MSEQKKKIYMSSSAFAWGQLVFTDSKAGCVRSILLSANGVREGDIDETHKIRGALNEKLYETQLKEAGIEYNREYPVRSAVPGFPGVELSGRVDFVRRSGGVHVIDELKSTESKSVMRATIEDGKPKVTHLAQVVAYMLQLKIDKAMLIYTGYKNNSKSGEKLSPQHYEKIKERALEILIDDAGRICVDSVPTEFNVGDLYNHQKLAAEMIQSHKVGPRPKDAAATFGSPCSYCVWKPACDAYDSGAIERETDSFVSYAKQFSKGEKV